MPVNGRLLPVLLLAPRKAADAAAGGSHTYGEILESSVLIGASSVLTLMLGIIRTKALAVLLGPAGFGMLGVFTSIADLARAIAGMGINNSGVRQIAEAVASGDKARIATTSGVLNRVANLLGLLAAGLLVVFCRPISLLTFGTEQYATAIALLSLAVWLRLVADGQGALIQGTRRIGDLAKSGVLCALLGTLLGVPVVYFLGTQGVVPSLVAAAAMVALAQWWYCRKLKPASISLTFAQVRGEALSLLKLGLAFMASGLLMMGVAYVVRIIVARRIGLDAAGFYQAAWLLGGLYVGFILQAMGADFYPRLVAVNGNHGRSNQLVNEQTLIGLLLAGPGVIATLTFAPLVVAVLYSSEFVAAVELLRWICLGMTLRVITWPMGFIIVAQNRQVVFVLTELAWSVVSIALAWVCVGEFGLRGAGIAFFVSYVFHGVMIYPVVRVLSGFRWSSQSRTTALLLVASVGVVFCGFQVLPPLAAAALGILALLVTTVQSIRSLALHASVDRLPKALRQALGRLRPGPAP